eukprot:m51a1_g4993 putative hypotherical protein (197) ;mRNA; r:105060-105896
MCECQLLTNVGEGIATGCQRLRELRLAGCPQLCDESVGHLAALPALEVFDLGHSSRLTDVALNQISLGLPCLKSLTVSYSKTSSSALEDIRNARPSIYIDAGRSPRDTISKRRLLSDLAETAKDPLPYVSAQPLEEILFVWHANLCGTDETPYRGGVFHFELTICLNLLGDFETFFQGEQPQQPAAAHVLSFGMHS